MNGLKQEAPPEIVWKEAHGHTHHQFLRQAEEQTPINPTTQPLGFVIQLKRWTGNRGALHPQRTVGGVGVVLTAETLVAPGMTSGQEPIGDRSSPFEGLCRHPLHRSRG